MAPVAVDASRAALEAVRVGRQQQQQLPPRSSTTSPADGPHQARAIAKAASINRVTAASPGHSGSGSGSGEASRAPSPIKTLHSMPATNPAPFRSLTPLNTSNNHLRTSPMMQDGSGKSAVGATASCSVTTPYHVPASRGSTPSVSERQMSRTSGHGKALSFSTSVGTVNGGIYPSTAMGHESSTSNHTLPLPRSTSVTDAQVDERTLDWAAPLLPAAMASNVAVNDDWPTIRRSGTRSPFHGGNGSAIRRSGTPGKERRRSTATEHTLAQVHVSGERASTLNLISPAASSDGHHASPQLATVPGGAGSAGLSSEVSNQSHHSGGESSNASSSQQPIVTQQQQRPQRSRHGTLARGSHHLRDTTEHDEPFDAVEAEEDALLLDDAAVAEAQARVEADATNNSTDAGSQLPSSSILPKPGPQGDSDAALSRLEKMKKANDAKRYLGLKNPIRSARQGRRKSNRERLQEKERSKIRRRLLGEAGGDSDSDHEHIDFGKAFEGVKLKIAALPGVNVLQSGVRGTTSAASHAAKSVLRNAPGSNHISRHAPDDKLASPQLAEERISEEREHGSIPSKKTRAKKTNHSPDLPAQVANVLAYRTNGVVERRAGVIPERTGSAAPSMSDLSRPASSAAIHRSPTAQSANHSHLADLGAPFMSSPSATVNGWAHLRSDSQDGELVKPAPVVAAAHNGAFVDSAGSASDSDSDEEYARAKASLGRFDVSSSAGEEEEDAGEQREEDNGDSSQLRLEHGSQAKRKKKPKRRLTALLGDHSHSHKHDDSDAADDAEDIEADHDKEAASKPPSSTGHGKPNRAGSVGHQVSRGLHYATAQSRNRRAMEKYSPAPSKVLNGNGDLSTEASGSILRTNSRSPAPAASLSFTPLPAAGMPAESANSSVTDLASPIGGSSVDVHAEIPLGPELERQQTNASSKYDNFLQRWNTNNTFVSNNTVGRAVSLKAMLKGAPGRLFGKSKAKDTDAVSIISAPAEDPEQALNEFIGKVLQQENPDDIGEKLEYDILYENQRGLLVFGVPRFSSRVLFVGDPAPWTSGKTGRNVAYNVANAQLPDPSWEWVHPEWMIDMTGDTDESGWRYSGDFGQKYYRALRVLPNWGLIKGHERATKHLEKKQQKLEQKQRKQNEREDDGLEALKRSALSRGAKWTGTSDPWTFVRRRRWIRLRRRRALLPRHLASPAVEGAEESSEGEVSDSGTESTGYSSEDDPDMWAAADGHASGFLPRRLPGNLENLNPNDYKQDKRMQRRIRLAREFTGTLRELKSLLPAIIDPRKAHQVAKGQIASVTEEIDARNPFISWRLVKRRLEEPDLAFASSSIRMRERKYQERRTNRSDSKRAEAQVERPAMPSAFRRPQLATSDTVRALEDAVADDPPGMPDMSIIEHPIVPAKASDSRTLTRDALVEVNFRRVLRVLRACKLDRQKLELWRLWLGADVASHTAEEPLLEDLRLLGLAAQSATTLHEKAFAEKRLRALRRWRASSILPDPNDVWDVVERRLDPLMMTFEFQGSRAVLIRLLLSQHSVTHPGHVFREDRPAGRLHVPSELSPFHQHGDRSELADGLHSVDAQIWRHAQLPRLQFWSDLYGVSGHIADSADVAAYDRQEKQSHAYFPGRPKSTAPEPIMEHQILADKACEEEVQQAILRPFSAPPSRYRPH